MNGGIEDRRIDKYNAVILINYYEIVKEKKYRLYFIIIEGNE